MSEQTKKRKKLKTTKKLKTIKGVSPKPGVVEKRKRKGSKKDEKKTLPFVRPEGLRRANIMFSIFFSIILVLTLVNIYVYDFIVLSLSESFLTFLLPIILYALLFLIILSFETYKIQRKSKIWLRIPLYLIFVALTSVIAVVIIASLSYLPDLMANEAGNFLDYLFVSFIPLIVAAVVAAIFLIPVFLVKFLTRHNVWRIIATLGIIWFILSSFFGPLLVDLSGITRSIEDGAPSDQFPIDTSGLSAPFIIDIDVDADSFMDLLDQLLADPDLAALSNATVANITTINGPLSNYLYRYEVYDYYNPETWDFELSDDVNLKAIPAGQYDAPSSGTYTHYNISQLIYTAASSVIKFGMLSTWSTNNLPRIKNHDNWDNQVEDLAGFGPIGGSASVQLTLADQFMGSASFSTGELFSEFTGSVSYETYFMPDENMETIIDSTMDYKQYLSTKYGTVASTYNEFLQKPTGYNTTSPNVVAFANTIAQTAKDQDLDVYGIITLTIDEIVKLLPNLVGTDTDGDGAERVAATGEGTFSDYIALASMVLRLNGIPVRPVLGFAVGTGDENERIVGLSNIYAWFEALLPIVDGANVNYKWGQFQLGPYLFTPKGGETSEYIYAENTLYLPYNVTSLQIYENTLGDLTPTDVSGIDDGVYLLDYDIPYTIRIEAERSGEPAAGGSVILQTFLASELASISNPFDIIEEGEYLVNDPVVTDSNGVAEVTVTLAPENFTTLDLNDPEGSSYVLLARIGVMSYQFAAFAIFPTGYFDTTKGVEINATKGINIDNPLSPGESFNYYFIQKGWKYELSSFLYGDELLSNPLENRTVSYYLMDKDTFDSMGEFDPTTYQDNLIRTAITDDVGKSTIMTYDSDTSTDYLADLALDNTYMLVATYGFNYTYSVILIVDDLYCDSTVTITGSDVDVEAEIYLKSPYMPDKEPYANNPIELWFIPSTSYSVYDGTTTEEDYKLSLNPNHKIEDAVTLGDGTYSYSNTTDDLIAIFGTGEFVFLFFYDGKWNASDSITLASPPWTPSPASVPQNVEPRGEPISLDMCESAVHGSNVLVTITCIGIDIRRTIQLPDMHHSFKNSTIDTNYNIATLTNFPLNLSGKRLIL